MLFLALFVAGGFWLTAARPLVGRGAADRRQHRPRRLPAGLSPSVSTGESAVPSPIASSRFALPASASVADVRASQSTGGRSAAGRARCVRVLRRTAEIAVYHAVAANLIFGFMARFTEPFARPAVVQVHCPPGPHGNLRRTWSIESRVRKYVETFRRDSLSWQCTWQRPKVPLSTRSRAAAASSRM